MYRVVLTIKRSTELLKKKLGEMSNIDLIMIRTWISEMTSFGPVYIESCGIGMIIS